MDAVSSIENQLHYGSTLDNSEKVTGDESHQLLNFTDERWWARKDSNLRPMDYESNGLTAGPIQINHIRTPIPRVCDWNGHI